MKHHITLKSALSLGLIVLAASSFRAQAADDDARIESAAKSSHVFKTYLKNDDVSVKSVDGAVILTGTVEQETHKILAQDTVAGVPGVKSVDNQIKIKTESPGKMSDAWIVAQIKTALLFHRNVSGLKTEVGVKEGVVTLKGEAKSDAQKELTGEYAKDIEGVKEVHNELVVAAPPPDAKPAKETTLGEAIDDASISAQVKLALLTHRSTSAIRTKVVAKDGVVTVSGEAKNAAEKDLVSKLVEDIDGVRKVVNAMTVQKS